LPELPGFQLAAGFEPARDLDGDYYDSIRLGDSSVAIAIGDVSGIQGNTSPSSTPW
jgi:serine phosphatase RsbU (regulator of sigma subunit)